MLQARIAETAPDPAAGLLLQFLAWVAAQPRSYGETMDAWRSSCPRISVWEDALGDGLVQVDGAGAETQGEARVMLTPAGRNRLAQALAPLRGRVAADQG
jgi:hypothetical protein